MSVDWAKPLELLNGLPVRLATDADLRMMGGYDETNPDRDGDYWVIREDGGRIRGYYIYCVRPDGSERSENLPLVRNRESDCISTTRFEYSPFCKCSGLNFVVQERDGGFRATAMKSDACRRAKRSGTFGFWHIKLKGNIE